MKFCLSYDITLPCGQHESSLRLVDVNACDVRDDMYRYFLLGRDL